MSLISQKSKRKATGGRYKDHRKKRVFEIRNLPVLTKLALRRVRSVRVRGAIIKQSILAEENVNVYDSKSKKYSKEKIKTIVENVANRHFVRRNIITKGAVVETEKGKVKITSRPGQVGVLSGIRV